MADGLGSAGANTVLDALLAAYPWIKFHVGLPGAAGTSNAAVETTRKQATWSASVAGASASTNTLTWTAVAGSETYTHFSAWTASTAGTFGWSGSLTANPVNIGDTFVIAIGGITVSFTLAS